MASPRVLNPQVIVPPSRQSARVGRYPDTPFNLKFKPFEIQPMCCFPVLPGESLKNLKVQLQCWTDPCIANSKNTGWSLEMLYVYARFQDLPGWEAGTDGLGKDMRDMIVNGEAQTGNQDADGNTWTYCAPGALDYVLAITKRTVECYYRYEGETWDHVVSAEGVPMAAINGRGRGDVWDKLTMFADYADRRTFMSDDGSSSGDPASIGDIERLYQEWAATRDGLADMSMDFHDWLRASGGRSDKGNVDPDREDFHIPEDLGHFREWTYPTNTVEPSTGVPAVMAGWRLDKELKKAFRFDSWGWIVGFICCRPKLYLKNQQGLVAGMMQARENWFPPQLDTKLSTSHLVIDDGTGPLKATMDAGNVDYVVDLRDLLNRGEQFLNYAPAAASAPVATAPNADGSHRYASASDAMAIFSDTTNGRIRCDGVVSASFLGQPVVKEVLHNQTLGEA